MIHSKFTFSHRWLVIGFVLMLMFHDDKLCLNCTLAKKIDVPVLMKKKCYKIATNTTKLSASKPTKKTVYWKVLFPCSPCLYKYWWSFAFRGHIQKTENKNDNLSRSILMRMLSVFFGNKIDLIAFRGHIYISIEELIFC